MTNKYIYNIYYCLEDDQRVILSCIYQSPLDQKWPTIMTAVDIDCHYIKKWPTNTSMLFTTVLNICWIYISTTTLKHVTQKYIPRIYWSLLFQEGRNKYIYNDYHCLEMTKSSSIIYIYIDHCRLRCDQNISIMITTVLKMTKSSSIIYIYIYRSLLSQVWPKYIYNDYYCLENDQE